MKTPYDEKTGTATLHYGFPPERKSIVNERTYVSYVTDEGVANPEAGRLLGKVRRI